MENIFLFIYEFFRTRRTLLWVTFILLVAVLALRAWTVQLEEDITRIFPSDKRVEKIDYVFRNSRLSERLVIMLSVKDSSFRSQPDNMVSFAQTLVDSVSTKLSSHIRGVHSQVDETKILEVFQIVQNHLPVFLDDRDYRALDSLMREESVKRTLEANYRQLITPSGIATKNLIVKDPLGISFLVLKKLQHLQYDQNFELYDNYIVTKDHRHLLLFIQPVYSPDDTKHNAVLLEAMDKILSDVSASYPELSASIFGASVVAAGNARQLQRDTILTVSLMIVLLMTVLLGYFRKKRVPFLILLPVVFGAVFSLACISFFQTTLSILALAVGAVILGVAVDYSLHYLVLLRDFGRPEIVIRQLVKPLTIGSATTVLAFFCLKFTNAAVLQDVGLFAAFSLIGAALCSLVFLPHFAGPSFFSGAGDNNWVSRIARTSFEARKPVVYAILLLTPVFLFFASGVKFNEDMGKLNFMTPETREAEKRLEHINRASLSGIYVVSSGKTLEEAIVRNEVSVSSLEQLRNQDLVNKITTVSNFLISDSLQHLRIQKWNAFWTAERTQMVRDVVRQEGSRLRFSPLLINNADSLVSRQYSHMSAEGRMALKETFFEDLIIEKGDTASVITLAHVFPENKHAVYKALDEAPSYSFDRRMLTNLFIEYVNADFTYIVSVTSILVFFMLLISYGRIELTLVTFVPMLFTWIWILGIMALVGIEFNIVNVMVSTFIFGLGDDYSIFIMDGLQQEYRAGRKSLGSIRTSIFLSAFTTMSGLGVLVFAQHPALRSIAAISIIGIGCVFMMSQTLEPYFFRLLITNRTKKGLAPMTLRGILITMYTYGFFVFGSFLLTAVGLVFKILPGGRKNMRILFHRLIRFFTNVLMYGAFNLKKQILNKNAGAFDRSSVIISNHSSFLDILLTTSLHYKLILLTNKWVWNSPVFGGVVRLADYYPVMEGADDSVTRLRQRAEEGYSVVVFPEGTRSPDGKIRRFHKGAFFMAEAMSLPLQPLLIHGADQAIPKGTIYVNDSTITLKFLPPIEPQDTTFGTNYTEKTKNISRYFKAEHRKLALEHETPAYFRSKLLTNYLYKGPVLEWYARVKIRLEKDYADFHKLIPRKATVLDLGCGYGFLDYMLQFLSEDRYITGVDYDEEKIETAHYGFLRTERLQFIHADVTKFELHQYDVIIISDVLHYLTSTEQEDLVNRCFAALNPGGKLIVREGNRDLKDKHRGTWLTELFSVKLLRFNKARNELNFISGKQLENMALNHGLKLTVHDETRYTSNVIFVISKPGAVHETV